MKIKRFVNSPIEFKVGGEDGCVIKEHSHKELSIGIILKGSTTVVIDNREYRVERHNLILIPENRVHLCIPDDKDNFRFIMVYIESNWLKNTFNIKTEEIEAEVCKGHSDIIKLVEKLVNKESLNESDYVLFTQELFLDNFKIIELPIPIEKKILTDVKEYLNSNFSSSISLNDLSNEYCINKYSLIRGFKRQFGLSPHSYLINLRINRAKELLKNDLDYTKIALDCGFYDQSHFIKTFKDYTGLTPDKFR